MPDEHAKSKRLNGAVILMLCGVPELSQSGEDASDDEVEKMEDQITRVEEAVISLSRAVFSAAGRLAFPDDVLLTPLVSQIASEYWEPVYIESAELQEERKQVGLEPIVVYEPRSELAEMETSVRRGYVHIQPEMPSNLAAVIAIGGNKMQSTRFARWQNQTEKIPFYVVASTGGVAATLLVNSPFSDVSDDGRLWQRIESARKEISFPISERPFSDEEHAEISKGEYIPDFRYSIYPLLMSNIVDEVAERLGR